MNKKCKCSNIFEDQKEFMVACNQNVCDVTEENNYNEFFLWSKLINEGHSELSEAILNSFNINRSMEEDPDVAIASEAIDLIYVTCGLLNNMGIDGQAVFDAIHDANMSKVINGKVLKNKDGKVLKPEGWKKADITEVLNKGCREWWFTYGRA
jgi:predicted HAD superfamily Cof-like phosphohydrolase